MIPESNLGFEALWVSREMKMARLENVYPMVEDHNRVGVRMNHPLKKMMAISMNEKIRDERIKLYQHFITIGVSERERDERLTPEKMIKDLYDQHVNYSRIITPSKQAHGETKEKYCGKNGYGFDDHVIALGLINVMNNIFRSKDEYRKFQE